MEGKRFSLTSRYGHLFGGKLKQLEGPRPTLSFDHEFTQGVDVLYDNIYGLTALRYNLSTQIPDGVGDEKIKWNLDWEGREKGKEYHETGEFHIARWEQKWRGGFFSCNGFDMTVPEGTVKQLGFDNVWKHLNSIHDESALHILIWGGDQVPCSLNLGLT